MKKTLSILLAILMITGFSSVAFTAVADEPALCHLETLATDGGTAIGGDYYPSGDTAEITATPDENYIFVGWYEGDNLFSDKAVYEFTVTKDITLTAKFEPKALKLSAINVTMTYNIAKKLSITVYGANNAALSNKNVTITFNGKKYYLKSDSNGKASFIVPNTIPKTYTATVECDGVKQQVKIAIKKASPKLKVTTKAFKANVKTKKYSVTLKDNKGKALKKAKVTLTVRGKTYKATTNAKGNATFKITKLTKKGNYNASIKYKGDKYYNAASKKAKITVK